jgi:hypothetical protein
MKKAVKIILIILAILLIIAIGIGIYATTTIKQGLALKDAIESIDLEELERTAEEIRAGNCSKLDEFENNIEEVKVQIIEACKNTALRKIIEDEQPGTCEIANNPNSDAQKELDELRVQCEATQ